MTTNHAQILPLTRNIPDQQKDFAPQLVTRLRRSRVSENMRRIVRETSLAPHHLTLPVFVEEGLDDRTPVSSMPGVFRETEKSLEAVIKDAVARDIGAVMVFGVSRNKDGTGSDSMRKGGLLDRMVKRAKDTAPELLIMADLCFCEYTDHGHCGPLTDCGSVDNDATLDNIARQALIAADAGADILAPSGMMDGQVGAIRQALDSSSHQDKTILAYAAKYASVFYGPFRQAAGCALQKGDRKTYQMDPANSDEAMREVALDLEEGADMIMVKPGLPYLDIISRVKREFAMPTFAYNVSGEYAMLKYAAQAGALDYDKAVMEMMLCFRRAGADGILTYAALDVAEILQK